MFAAGDQMQQCPGIPIMEMVDGRWKAHVQQAPNCPRCASTNTKFCYYNNYSLAQPRYFCKACRRYWTKGGSLRNVPVGGGCRKTRRRSRSRSHNPAPSGPHQPASSSSPEIDLAAVFARYLDQPLSPADQLATSSQSNYEQGDRDLHLFDTTDLGILDHGFMLQPEDVFWSTSTEDGPSLSATSGLAPEQQELDSSAPLALYAASVLDDQFSAASLLGDFNWSCFDLLPGYGDFCRST